MSTIWRMPVPQGERNFFLTVPQGSRYMKCLLKDGQPQIYFKVPDPKADPADVMLYVVPTGIELTDEEDQAVYLDSFVIPDTALGSLVFHLLMEAVNG